MANRKHPDQPTGAEALKEISERLGGLFEKVRDVVDAADEKVRDIDEVIEVGDDNGIKAVAGLRMRIGGTDVGTGSRGDGPSAKAPRERSPVKAASGNGLDFETHELNAEYRITAALDEFEEPAVGVSAQDDKLIVSVSGEKFETSLPTGVDVSTLSFGIRNGILEITFDKAAS